MRLTDKTPFGCLRGVHALLQECVAQPRAGARHSAVGPGIASVGCSTLCVHPELLGHPVDEYPQARRQLTRVRIEDVDRQRRRQKIGEIAGAQDAVEPLANHIQRLVRLADMQLRFNRWRKTPEAARRDSAAAPRGSSGRNQARRRPAREVRRASRRPPVPARVRGRWLLQWPAPALAA